MSYEKIKCPLCESQFSQEKKFVKHLSDCHEIDDHFVLYLQTFHGGTHPKCTCKQDCKSLLTWSGWKLGFLSKFSRGHNARIDSAYKNPEISLRAAEKRREGFKNGKYSVWNKGLTKDNCNRLKDSATKISTTLAGGYSTGKIADWRKDSEKAESAARKSSRTKKEKYDSGQTTSWNLGLSKDDHPSLERAARKISVAYEKREAGRRICTTEFLKRAGSFSEKFTLLSDVSEYRRRRVDRLLFECNSCGERQEKSLAMLEESPICFKCHPKESVGQLEVHDFIKSLGYNPQLSVKDVIPPKEIDIWIPDKNLAIEYNGLYWHSSECKLDPLYHYKKLLACRDAGVNLFSIYEDEWRDKKEIVKGMIKHRLCGASRKFDAKELVVKDVAPSDARQFFDDNHLEGHVLGTRYIGLVEPLTGELLAAVSLRKSFHKKYDGMIELGRCCPKLNCNIRGWLGKLSSAAKKYCKSIGVKMMMTYVDMRVGFGVGYLAAGWKHAETGKSPRFWWTDFNKRINRFSIRADSKNNVTQADAALAAGVSKIFGMPNIIFYMPI